MWAYTVHYCLVCSLILKSLSLSYCENYKVGYLMTVDLDVLTEIVVSAAKQELMPAFGRERGELKKDGSIVTKADLAMNQHLRLMLHKHWPQIGFLSEEMPHSEQEALLGSRNRSFWILDPLDGTTNFAAGIPFFAVSLALYKDEAIQLGIVYDPVRGECFCAQAGQSSQYNGKPIKVSISISELSRGVGIIDMKRLTKPLATKIAVQPPYTSQRSFGSVALDWCWLAMGRGHVYLHGKQKIWDYAAGQLILAQAGGKACTLEGEPIMTSLMTPRSAVAASTSLLHKQWCEWLGVVPHTE